ncbi:MAG: penicillin-binding protein 2 [Patescibacteria group bacterium]|jgi:penicillin-binding protein 2
MKDIFHPYLDRTIKDKKIDIKYTKQLVDFSAPENVKNDFLGGVLADYKIASLFVLFGLGFVLLMSRLFYVQIIKGDYYLAQAENNRIHINYLPAPRGIIYDTKRVPLVSNIPNFMVVISTTELPTDPTIYQAAIQTIANVLVLSEADLANTITQHNEQFTSQPLIVKDDIPYEQALTIATSLKQISGVGLEAQAIRSYPKAEAFAHILGYLSKIQSSDLILIENNNYLLTDRIGKTGLEAFYETELKGKKGREQIEVNPSGLNIKQLAKEEPQAGHNIILALDSNLQTVLYNALADTAKTKQLPGGAAIALDPRNGQIKALVSYPGYDNNLFTKGISQADYTALNNDNHKPLFNKAISGNYPSGSTFKLVVSAAGLQEGIITPTTTVNSIGGITINKSKFPDWKTGGHGITNIYQALAWSVNTYFYILGGGTYDENTNTITGGLGIERINNYAKLFGLGKTTGIDLPYEAEGFLPSPTWKETIKQENWYIGDTYHVAIGQGDLLVTPLQVALYTSVIANGGILFQPKLVDAITDQSGNEITKVTPMVIRDHVVDQANLAIVKEGMRQAVTIGSAKKIANLPVTSGAKTGTAQVAGNDQNLSWFTVFAPYDDPELVITVLVEDGGEGADSALPIAKQALLEYFSKIAQD